MVEKRLEKISTRHANRRADLIVAELLGVSRAKVVNIFQEKGVTSAGKVVLKSDKLYEGQLLEIQLPAPIDPLEIVAEKINNLEVIYYDDDIVVINKPAGIAAHPSLGWQGSNVLSGLKEKGFKLANSGPAEQNGIVHRLDVGTSGLMMVACSETAYRFLKLAFKNRSVTKKYYALAQGYLDPLQGTISAPIAPHKSNQWKFRVAAKGKPSVTHYETIEMFRYASLLDIQLETGRTHQIRVHLSALHHPCCGDLTYGADPTLATKLGLSRQWLHAYKLSFVHPASAEKMEFECDYPSDLQNAIDILTSIN